MRRGLVAIAVVLAFLASVVFAGTSGMPYLQAPPAERTSGDGDQKARSEGESSAVDIKSDLGRQTDHNGSKIYIVVGNVAAHHNGAVITCDSAVRYSERRLECFGNVLINKGTTYIYGERAEYNGDLNEAYVYSRIVKVVDRSATLYTYNFKFNTKENIGEYYGGGVVTNDGDMLESERGYYYADLKDVICVDDVQMRNETYDMTGDSVVYNIETNKANFFYNTNIWNTKENEYLYADCGSFDRDSQLYSLKRNGYILTENQELWSDTLDYFRESGYARLKSNIQIDDRSQMVMAFGDWGEYWKEPGNAFLTKDPIVLSYDVSQGDSVFMRSDSMFLYTRDPVRERIERERADSLRAAAERADSIRMAEEKAMAEKAEKKMSGKRRKGEQKSDEESVSESETGPNAEQNRAEDIKARADKTSQAVREKLGLGDGESSGEIQAPADTLATDSLRADTLPVNPMDTLTKAERRAMLKEKAKKERDSVRKVKAEILRIKLDSIADRRQAKRTALLIKAERADSVRNAKAQLRAEEKFRRSMERLTRKGIKVAPVDSAVLFSVDSIIGAEMFMKDSVTNRILDSLISVYFPKEEADSVAVADTVAVDSTYRMVLGYRNVRMYRSDFQAVCDSIVATSIDSVIHLFISPVLWNDNNQITSEKMHIITRNQQIVRADFEGKPMTAAEIDTVHYNQVTGKEMSAFFENNQIYRNDVNGNVQTIYYMQEEGSPDISMLAYVESGDMSSYVEDRQIVGITYRNNPTYIFYPLDKIPEDQPIYLDGFKWEIERRPSRSDVMTRRIRESLREVKERLEKPTFPITDKIDSDRRRLIRQKLWSDRTDTLSAETIEWLDNLSYDL